MLDAHALEEIPNLLRTVTAMTYDREKQRLKITTTDPKSGNEQDHFFRGCTVEEISLLRNERGIKCRVLAPKVASPKHKLVLDAPETEQEPVAS